MVLLVSLIFLVKCIHMSPLLFLLGVDILSHFHEKQGAWQIAPFPVGT